tara:strand:- start:23 stop:265 length:243 start_codon:yes stop_codon:yes gene_type:complete
MDTKFIPFNLETMDQAISFKTTDGAVVTQVTEVSDRTRSFCQIVGVIDGELIVLNRDGKEFNYFRGRELLMEVANTTYTR